jgi:hypothetical protein
VDGPRTRAARGHRIVDAPVPRRKAGSSRRLSPVESTEGRGWEVRILAFALLLSGGVLVGSLVLASQSKIDQSTAIQIASDFAFKSQPAGSQIRGVRETSVSEVGNAWRIEISFEALYPGSAAVDPLPVHLLIDVDKGSGTPRLVGQGRVMTPSRAASGGVGVA